MNRSRFRPAFPRGLATRHDLYAPLAWRFRRAVAAQLLRAFPTYDLEVTVEQRPGIEVESVPYHEARTLTVEGPAVVTICRRTWRSSGSRGT